MVRPEIASDLKSLRLYCGAHVKIGNMLFTPKTTLFLHVWFLNLCNGSSGKKTSATRRFSFWYAVFSGGRQTLCISTIVVAPATLQGHELLSSTLFPSWLIMMITIQICAFCVSGNGRVKEQFFVCFVCWCKNWIPVIYSVN